MKALLKATISTTLALFLLFLGSCGSKTDSCTPNFSQGNFGARVTFVVGSLNTYEFEVCYNDSYAGTLTSVYGVELEADIATLDTAADVRLAHMTDVIHPGDRFPVTFANDDAWFVIYADDNLGNLDNSEEILRGQFR